MGITLMYVEDGDDGDLRSRAESVRHFAAALKGLAAVTGLDYAIIIRRAKELGRLPEDFEDDDE